ncbi:MAG: hypothetical protein GY811_13705 [Myxococcales bacterium]|nr:hypothetical protein [Myxococcales bacterium]
MKWFHRIAERISGGEHAPSEHGEAISELFYRRSIYSDSAAFLKDLLALFPDGEPLADSDLKVLISVLRGVWGAEQALVDGELSEQSEFWLGLASHTGSAYAHACYGDTLLVGGRPAEAVEAFALSLELAPELLPEIAGDLDDVAREVGGEPWLHFSLAKLAALIGGQAGPDDDESRELYSELLEEFAGDSSALERIHYHGEVLEEAVKRGELPRALVLRSGTRTEN